MNPRARHIHGHSRFPSLILPLLLLFAHISNLFHSRLPHIPSKGDLISRVAPPPGVCRPEQMVRLLLFPSSLGA
ncbi:hypothetical protein F5Y07DRAFT_280644 [Xylaria sp. FL0933]|nr:hypothetical protein F5Y07DRAFT_280644 [Xylaria sp. FL0933]